MIFIGFADLVNLKHQFIYHNLIICLLPILLILIKFVRIVHKPERTIQIIKTVRGRDRNNAIQYELPVYPVTRHQLNENT